MELHVGRIIAGRLEEVGMSKSEFARRINKARQNINDILNRKSMDTDLLLSISKALNYDFFQHYVKALNTESSIQEPHSEYANLREQVNTYEKQLLVMEREFMVAQKENELLKEIVDLLKKQQG